jgi:hypothetical protein
MAYAASARTPRTTLPAAPRRRRRTDATSTPRAPRAAGIRRSARPPVAFEPRPHEQQRVRVQQGHRHAAMHQQVRLRRPPPSEVEVAAPEAERVLHSSGCTTVYCRNSAPSTSATNHATTRVMRGAVVAAEVGVPSVIGSAKSGRGAGSAAPDGRRRASPSPAPAGTPSGGPAPGRRVARHERMDHHLRVRARAPRLLHQAQQHGVGGVLARQMASACAHPPFAAVESVAIAWSSIASPPRIRPSPA